MPASSTPQESIDAYDAQAEDWATYLRSGNNLAQRFVEKPAMESALPELQGRSVLSVGCGSGEELEGLAGREPARLVGVDISQGMIDVAKRQFPKYELHVMDMEKLDFPDGAFDVIYSSLTIHYVAEWQAALKEWSRVLKPGGTILFSTQHPVYMSATTKGWGLFGYAIRAGFSYFRPLRHLIAYGDYFRSGRQTRTHDAAGSKLRLITFRKTFAAMLSEINTSGLVMEQCLEPEPTAEAAKLQPRWVKMYRALPQFVIFRLRKP